MSRAIHPALATVLTFCLLTSSVTEAGPLKPTMKEMRLHFKQALESETPEQFNQEVQLFIEELKVAQAFNFSPERKAVSLEGLNKIDRIVTSLPPATAANLQAHKEQLRQIDSLRKEYHDKAKPSVLDLLLDTLKETLGL